MNRFLTNITAKLLAVIIVVIIIVLAYTAWETYPVATTIFCGLLFARKFYQEFFVKPETPKDDVQER